MSENPHVKYWGTPHDKELMLGKQEVSVTAKQGQLFVKLHETNGIEIHSPHSIVLTSGKNIELHAAGQLTMNAKEAVYLLCHSSSMMLDGITDIQGLRVEMDGAMGPPVVSSAEKRAKEMLNRMELAQQIAGSLPLGGSAGAEKEAAASIPLMARSAVKKAEEKAWQ
ncbi:hypothetical protein [Aneurinibacillus aneurinilyticus]|jgi:hypothetical protein|uniref:hypothetical protein n=1 Tax=Aneurinibacillus aneurinilyticus TaxID=1391 RepID=UPI0023F90626|nr:hypothetical protein [Aneurinibacillus aneurinilyticus]MCI1696914.1 hypothetical protein [Aneurinibacillus aneurinilyticus]